MCLCCSYQGCPEPVLHWGELVLAGEQGPIGCPQPISHPILRRLLSLWPLRPHPRLAVTDRPPPALLIGSAVANGAAVARWEWAAQASPYRAALCPGERGLTGARLMEFVAN